MMILQLLVVLCAALADDYHLSHRRRLGPTMGKGEGNQTTMLGGGNGGSWIVAKRLIDSVDQTKDGAKLVNIPDAPGSNGYSRWLEHVKMHA